jgi:hypothetical protein
MSSSHSTLSWPYDSDTQYWASAVSLLSQTTPAQQYGGHSTPETTWASRIRNRHFPAFCQTGYSGNISCSPANIIACFQQNAVLEGLALVVSWGAMGRTSGYIYQKGLPTIEQTLRQGIIYIQQQNSVQSAWDLLVHQLGWTSVMTSKCLHFVARSLRFMSNPPVPIDGAVMITRVWPKFLEQIQNFSHAMPHRIPKGWGGSSWEEYNRYMTAINCWAAQKKWTTTEVENTLFACYKP